MSSSQITAAFLNVGQGDSTVVILPDKKTAHVIDCPYGQTPAVYSYLGERGIEVLDIVFVTHTDLDHLGGIPRLIEDTGEVKSVAWNIDRSNIRNSVRKNILQHLLLLHRERSIIRFEPRSESEDATRYQRQAVLIEVLHPTPNDLDAFKLANDPNNASVVLMLSFANQRILLPGDLMELGWANIIGRGVNIKADVFKFPHHGAWFTPDAEYDLEAILERIYPQFVVISAGTTNQYSHPRTETVALLRKKGVAFLCTQATATCWKNIPEVSQSLPCAGNIEIQISEGEMKIIPQFSPLPDCGFASS